MSSHCIPGAVEQYRADVERLAALAAEHNDFAESAELIEAVRRLVAGASYAPSHTAEASASKCRDGWHN